MPTKERSSTPSAVCLLNVVQWGILKNGEKLSLQGIISCQVGRRLYTIYQDSGANLKPIIQRMSKKPKKDLGQKTGI